MAQRDRPKRPKSAGGGILPDEPREIVPDPDVPFRTSRLGKGTNRDANSLARSAAARRRKVAEMRLAGYWHQGDIAQKLGVDQSTISTDFKALDAEWRASNVDLVTEAKNVDLERLNTVIQINWPLMAAGDPDAARVILQVIQTRAKILGYEAPQKIQINAQILEIAARYNMDPDVAMSLASKFLLDAGLMSGGGRS